MNNGLANSKMTQLALFNQNPTKQKKPDLKFKLMAYKTLDINQKVNLKSWFFSDSKMYGIVSFWSFINQSLVLVNVNNNEYYTSNLK